jgi:hypothetical protein
MSFLYPVFLLGALAIALPIALHLLRRDVAPEVPFSAVRLLRRSPIDRSRRRRLRDLILLAARVTALVLLALAFARPYLTGAAATSGLRIVAIDRSFSMGAPGRFARAIELATAAIDDAGADERVAVVAFDDRADVLAAPGGRGDARAALASLTPGFGATRYAPAIARAIELSGGSPAHLVIVSDLQRNGWEDDEPATLPAHVQVEMKDAGAPAANLAVVHVDVEPERIVAAVRNSSNAPVTRTARVSVDGRVAASSTVTVPGNNVADVAVAYRPPRTGRLEFAIDDETGYAADNSRHVILDPPLQTRVLVVTTSGARQSGLYVARALEAADEHAFEVRVASGAEASAMASEEMAKHAAIVLLSTNGLDRRGREEIAVYLRDGGGLLVAAGPDVDASVLVSALGWSGLGSVAEVDVEGEPASLSVSDVRHPVFRPFGALAANLGQVRFERLWKLNPQGWELVARFDGGSPALVERVDGQGRAMLFASDLDRRWNEFPAHPAFVPFIVEAIRHVAGERNMVREYVVADAPSGTGPAPGVYTAKDGRIVAVNVDPRESAVAALTPREFSEMLVSAPQAEPDRSQRSLRAQAVEARQNLWQYGLVLMLAILVLESVVGRA